MKPLIRPPHARLVMAFAGLIGLFASGYLFYTYVTGAKIACAVVRGCDVVRASRWAYVYGVPRPFLGLVFYAAVFALLVLRVTVRSRPRLLYRLTLLAALVGFLESAHLFFIQWLDIHAFCFWCLVSGASTTVIALMAFFDRNETERHASVDRELKWYFWTLLVFLPIAFFGFVGLMQMTRAEQKTSSLIIPVAPELLMHVMK